MFHRKNVGPRERWARLAGGALVAACSLTLLGFTPLGLGGAATGAAFALTGVVGFCPACALFGRQLREPSR